MNPVIGYDSLMIESSIDAMVAIKTNELIIAWNRAANILFDMDATDAIGKRLYDVMPEFKDFSELYTAIQLAGKGRKSFIPPSSNLNSPNYVETHVIPLREEDTIVGILLLFHDVSHRLAKEKELQRLNNELQNRIRELHITSTELTQLTHIAGHNIRTPVREIYTTVEGLLRTESKTISHSGRAAFRRIQSSLNRMNLLLDDIITLTQINIAEHPRSTINTAEVIEEIKTQFYSKLRDSKTVFSVGQLCELRAHRNQVSLLLQQIVSCLIKFADDRSPRIHIECSRVFLDETSSIVKEPNEYYLLSITHNSTAFDNADWQANIKLTEDNDIRNYAGPVIAMVIAEKIMEVHGGFIKGEGTENGERINFYFPVAMENSLISANQ
jgi:PAS domain S-box-containing protein